MAQKATNATQLTQKDRKELFLQVFAKSPFNVSAACDAAKIHRATFYRWLKLKAFAEKVHEIKEGVLDEVETALLDQIRAGNIAAIIFSCKTLLRGRGYIEGKPKEVRREVSREELEILDMLLMNEIDAPTAAIKFDRLGLPLPPGLEAVLKRTIMPEPEGEEKEGLTDEQLEAKYLERMRNTQEQRDVFLPARRKEVEELKSEMKGLDSFSPGAITQR